MSLINQFIAKEKINQLFINTLLIYQNCNGDINITEIPSILGELSEELDKILNDE